MREYENENIVNINKELETSIGGTMKFLEELDKDMQKYNASLKNLVEEQAIFVGQLVKKGLEDKTIKQDIVKL